MALPIASASKWLYASYVVRTKGSALSQQDVAFLTFRSGYTQFTRCAKLATVGGCIAAQDGLPQDGSDEPDPGWGGSALVGSFDYGGAHMQKHASLNPALRGLRNAGLADEMNRVPKLPSLASMPGRAEGEPVERPAQQSVACGKLIRQAWLTGMVQ